MKLLALLSCALLGVAEAAYGTRYYRFDVHTTTAYAKSTTRAAYKTVIDALATSNAAFNTALTTSKNTHTTQPVVALAGTVNTLTRTSNRPINVGNLSTGKVSTGNVAWLNKLTFASTFFNLRSDKATSPMYKYTVEVKAVLGNTTALTPATLTIAQEEIDNSHLKAIQYAITGNSVIRNTLRAPSGTTSLTAPFKKSYGLESGATSTVSDYTASVNLLDAALTTSITDIVPTGTAAQLTRYFHFTVTTAETYAATKTDTARIAKEASIDTFNNAHLMDRLIVHFNAEYGYLSRLDRVLELTSNSYNLRSYTAVGSSTAVLQYDVEVTAKLVGTTTTTVTATDLTNIEAAIKHLLNDNLTIFKTTTGTNASAKSLSAKASTKSTSSTSNIAFTSGLVALCLLFKN